MSVMSMNSRMAMAEKLSVPQLQQAIQSGSLPAYIGIPLIEQKTREKSQMAAAQQGQQKPPSVASQVLQQADEQERGIDELPSNLPVAQDEEMGMAGGGIVAFADRGLVEDRRSPSDIAMQEVIDKIMRSQTFGGTPTPKSDYEMPYEPVPASPAGRYIQDKLTDTKGALNTYDLRERLYKQYSPAASGLSNVSDAERSAANAMLARIRGMSASELRALAGQGSTPAMTAVETTSQATPQTAPPAASNSLGNNAGPEYEPGITAVPGQRPPQAPPQGAQPGINTLPSGARPSAGTGQPSLRDVQAMAGAPSAAQPESAMDRYARMLEAQGEDSAKARKDAKAMAIIQAGLGIAGGTSPNAFANIAQGAMPAIQSYQQALQGLRKDDRDRIKQLMDMGVSKEKLGLELKKLGIEQQKADQIGEYYRGRVAAGGSKNELTEKQERELFIRASGAVNKIRGDYNKATSDATYKMNTQIVNNPKVKPEQRERAQAYIDNVDSQFKPALQEAMEIANLYKPASMQTAGGAGGTPKITNQAEYNKLEKGQQYIDPNGVLRTKG